jgi:hypothetical protein
MTISRDAIKDFLPKDAYFVEVRPRVRNWSVVFPSEIKYPIDKNWSPVAISPVIKEVILTKGKLNDGTIVYWGIAVHGKEVVFLISDWSGNDL